MQLSRWDWVELAVFGILLVPVGLLASTFFLVLIAEGILEGDTRLDFILVMLFTASFLVLVTSKAAMEVRFILKPSPPIAPGDVTPGNGRNG